MVNLLGFSALFVNWADPDKTRPQKPATDRPSHRQDMAVGFGIRKQTSARLGLPVNTAAVSAAKWTGESLVSYLQN